MTLNSDTSKKIGYARVSMQKQDLDLQMDALRKIGVKEKDIFIEKISGRLKNTERPQLDLCLKMLRPGDTLVVWKLDRLGRSLHDLVNILSTLEEQKIHFYSLTEVIDTSSPTGKLMFHLIAVFAEFERSLIQERAIAGLEAARKRGVIGGRRMKLSKTQQAALVAMYNAKMPIREIMTQFNISKSCVYDTLERQNVRERRKHSKT